MAKGKHVNSLIAGLPVSMLFSLLPEWKKNSQAYSEEGEGCNVHTKLEGWCLLAVDSFYPIHAIYLGTRKMDSFCVDVVVPIYCFSGDLVCCDQTVIFFFFF